MAINRSTFVAPSYTPDQFSELYDLSPNQLTQAQRYQILKMKVDKTQAELSELNGLTLALQNYLITPERFNHFQNALYNMQVFIKDEVEGYIQDKQTEFNATLQRFNHKGEYNSTTQYQQWNTVTFNGETYLALKNTLNQSPNPNSDTEFWAKIARRGAQGVQGVAGTGLRFKGAYNISTQYTRDDAVQYGGQIYACLQDNIGEEPNPNTNTAYWALAVSKGQSTKVTMLENTVVVNNVTSNVPIGIPEYNSVTDGLIVIKNSTTLTKNDGYTINANGSSINSVGESWDGTTTPVHFHFIVFKNFVTDLTFSDGNMIQNETVGKEKLKLDLQNEINEKANESDLQALSYRVSNIKGYALKGSANFNSTLGTVIPHSIGHTNYQVLPTPTQNPNGYLGEVWIEKSMNSFIVKCSGTATISFDYIVFE